MNTINNNNDQKDNEVIEIQKNYEDDYWAKKYDVSTEELKTGRNIALAAKIIKASFKQKSFA